MSKVHILTGATGFLGNNLVKEFLARGDKLILFTRAKDGVSAEQRIYDTLKLTDTERTQVRVYEVDILQDIFEQVDVDELATVFGKIDNIWHLAANLSFRFEEREKTLKTNVEGTRHMVHLAMKLGARLFYFSTAYMHGQRQGILREDDLIKSTYNNPYEESKYRTEAMLHEYMHEGLKCTIFRPGILFDATPYHRQGHVSGYYVLLLSLWNVKRGLLKFAKHRPRLAGILGLRADGDMVVSRFVSFIVAPTVMNLIAVQDAMKAMLTIHDKQDESKNTTYHIVTPYGLKIRDITRVMFETLGIRARIIELPVPLVRVVLYVIRGLGHVVPLFKGFGRKMRYYAFYITNTREFDLTNTYAVVGEEEYKAMFNDEVEVLKIASQKFLEVW